MSLTELVRALSPNRPLDGDDDRYVERPENGGHRLARIAAVDPDPIAVFGPPGVGKSTELTRAAQALEADALPVLVRLDRRLDMGRISVADVYGACGAALDDKHLGVIPYPAAHFASKDRLLDVIRTVTSSTWRRVVFLIDGLEKADDSTARQILTALGALAGEAGLIIVVPPTLVIGPEGFQVMETSRHFSIGPLPLGLQVPFLRALLTRRAPGHALPDAVITEAIHYSGGIPRTFLSLLKSAALYAILADRDAIESSDMNAAIAEHREAMSRILAGGDIKGLAASTTGYGIDSLPTETRARLLSHGALLEQSSGGPSQYSIHPLLANEVQSPSRFGRPF